MVVPRDDPPVGTRGRPFRDLFFSGKLGRSQLPALAVVLENGRREVEVPARGRDIVFVAAEGRALHSGRRGGEAMESFSNRAAKLEILRIFMMIEMVGAEALTKSRIEVLKTAA